jgi:hypothetical protein
MGAIDCTVYFRNRVHPWQANWNRGDKHAFAINICLVSGTTTTGAHSS